MLKQAPETKQAFTCPAVLSLVSGFLIMLVIGSLYTFGTLSVYMTSYLSITASPNITTADVAVIFPLNLIMINAGIIVGCELARKVDIRVITLVGFTLYSACLLGMSFISTFAGYVGVYALGSFMLGLPYMLPMNNAMKYLPSHKGLCSGICIMGLGSGALVFNQIILAVMNPHNIKPSPSTHLFPFAVADNMPATWRVLAGVYFGLSLLGTAIMIPKDQQEVYSLVSSQAGVHTQCQHLADAVCHKKFYALTAFVSLSSSLGILIVFNYKQYGLLRIPDDQYLTLVASVGGVASGISRIFWGALLDCSSFKLLMLIINAGLLVVGTTLQFVASSKPLFLIYIVLSYFLYGGITSLMPARTYQIYGQKNGARVFSYVYIGYSLGSVLQFLLHFGLVDRYGVVGWSICLYALSGFQLIAVLLTFFTDWLEIDWREYYSNKLL